MHPERGSNKPVGRKRILGFDKKENCDTEKLLPFIWPSCWPPTVIETYCANENIKYNKKMKYFLQENFKKSVDYAIASIIGAGLRDEEITISFAKTIHQKIKAQVFHYLLKNCLKKSINMTQSKKYTMPHHFQKNR